MTRAAPPPVPTAVPLCIPAWMLLCGEQRFDHIADLRAPEAYARGHLAGARCVPYEVFQIEALALFPIEDSVLVVDPGGARAADFAVFLRRRGQVASYLEGGYAAWTGPLTVGAAP